MTEQKHWRVTPLAARRKREHHMLSTELIHERQGWRDGQARRCLLCLKVELAGLMEEVGSVQTRGARPGVHGGGSRHHSSGEVGSKKSNTSQLRWVGGRWQSGRWRGPAQRRPTSPPPLRHDQALWALLELSQSKWSGFHLFALQQLMGDLTQRWTAFNTMSSHITIPVWFLGEQGADSEFSFDFTKEPLCSTHYE